MSQYGWSDADAASRRRIAANAVALDPGTFQLLSNLQVGPSWRCAEIGAGVGTVARWLVERVGGLGHVVATDLNTRWLTDLSSLGVEIRVEDIAETSPGQGNFDLVHARAVLTHVGESERAVENMVAALRPGGWILLEEPDQGPPMGRAIPEEPAWERFADGLRILTEKGGGDAYYGRRVPAVLRNAGLTDVGVDLRTANLSPEISLGHLEGAGETLVSLGMLSTTDMDTLRGFAADPAVVRYGPIFVSAWGRKPL